MLSSHMEPYHGIEEKQSEYRNTFKPDIKGEEVFLFTYICFNCLFTVLNTYVEKNTYFASNSLG